MKNIDVLKPCPCGTGINFENCCQPHLLGLERPLTAEKLLRSRYTAFAAGNVDYILTTHHPDKAKEVDRASIDEWSKKSVWHGLEVIAAEAGGEKDGEGVVEFIAHYTQEGKKYQHHEVSLFKKHDDKWYFFDVKKNKPVRTDNKTGRNDPCHCGSGKKFKKCHGA